MKIFNYLKFRLLQFFRLFNYKQDFGAIQSVGLLCIILVDVYSYAILLTLPIVLLHIRRKDLTFIKSVIEHWRYCILLEYSVLYFFFIFININYKIGWECLFGWGVIMCLVFIPINHRTEYAVIKWDFIPNILFEWKSHLRNKTMMSILGYIFLLISSYHTFTFLIMGYFYLAFVSEIYEKSENKEFFEMFFKKYTLIQKLKYSLYYSGMIIFPVCMLYIIINGWAYFPVAIHYFVSINLYLLLIISRKYSLYNHRIKEISFNSGIFMKYLISSITILMFFPIFKQNYQQSLKNINQF